MGLLRSNIGMARRAVWPVQPNAGRSTAAVPHLQPGTVWTTRKLFAWVQPNCISFWPHYGYGTTYRTIERIRVDASAFTTRSAARKSRGRATQQHE
jgi:hypothetical protein